MRWLSVRTRVESWKLPEQRNVAGAPASAFRGFGNPQATFARELMFDIAARALDIDPLEFRRRNVIRERDLPTRTANGLKLETLPIELLKPAFAYGVPDRVLAEEPGDHADADGA